MAFKTNFRIATIELTTALSLFKSIIKDVEEEDNNITYKKKVDLCESNNMLQCVDESSIPQILKTIQMKQLA